ncbi:putative cytochrome b5 [Paratrimastix pyriformis]|uniref:Cytochrome b5 n=1 Tax=Paratrimastix pyriformis TaxID=342808 RepID=A0ABQ8USE2_9EUKA|nr:putative cytochrome b5 [Paratrimastix pyriformis]
MPKVPLKPGHTLNDWLRFINSKTPDPPRPVSVEELARHNRLDDCWLSIKGTAYNFTSYLEFHPGDRGIAILNPYFGRDATVPFGKFHAYVSIENLMRPFAIGPLVRGSAGPGGPSMEGISEEDHAE